MILAEGQLDAIRMGDTAFVLGNGDPEQCPACGCYACEYEHCGCLCEACGCHLGAICDLGISDECGDAVIVITEPPPSTVRTQVCAACHAAQEGSN